RAAAVQLGLLERRRGLRPRHPRAELGERLHDRLVERGTIAGARAAQPQTIAGDRQRHVDEQRIEGGHHAFSNTGGGACNVASLAGGGSAFTGRIGARPNATAARTKPPMPANANAARRLTCSPSQPPISAPGPAGSRISQRIVLVMRPSSGSGVTAWRIARKL